MKKKKIIKILTQRVDALEKIIKPEGATFIDPDNKNKSVFIGISGGKITQDILVKVPETIQITNISNQNI